MNKATSDRIRNKSDELAVEQGCYFDEEAAAKAVAFFETVLVHGKGSLQGQPFKLLEWEKVELIEPMFGWKRADGSRRFNKIYIVVPKKNGKSYLMGGLILYLMTFDGESGLGLYAAATNSRQANELIYQPIKGLVNASKPLKKRLKCFDHTSTIVFPNGGEKQANRFKIVSRDAGGAEGLEGYVFIDELHAFKDRLLFESLQSAGAARKNPVLLMTTTFGESKTDLWYEEVEYGRGVNKGEIDDSSYLFVCYAAEEDADIMSAEVHEKANPSFGVTVSGDFLMQKALEASKIPSKLNAFKRYHLNILASNASAWIPQDKWAACAPKTKLKPKEYMERVIENIQGESCFGGLDIGATSDLTALSLLFPDGDQLEDDRPLFLSWFWMPENGRWKEDARRRGLYQQWYDDGFIYKTDGNVTDYDMVRRDINNIADQFNLRELAVDMLVNGMQISTQLADDGFDIVKFPQTFGPMTPVCRRFEEMIITSGGGMNHANNPIINWMAEHVAIETAKSNGDLIKPVKPSMGEGYKIDGIISMLGGLRQWMQNSEPKSAEPKVFVFDLGGNND